MVLKCRGNGVLGLDNFNDCYDPTLKRARQHLLEKHILKGKSIPVFEWGNHGTVVHDFTYIDDIVKGCLGALDTAEKSTGSGNTSPVPVSDLVSILEKLLKVKAKRRVIKLPRNGDVPFTHANISLAQRELSLGINPRRICKGS
ncbi:putative UDP-glucuronate 4-epimerase [Helianthus annuus]|uniref:UDP-glucuronate 4-epimerase n=1 Tax=Helianthus annuus TaxID=4232 RepID=A0A9K3EMP9_HELAN|nr:putative UDP-glucuronate 4-epimerase [Helianthus annuus]